MAARKKLRKQARALEARAASVNRGAPRITLPNPARPHALDAAALPDLVMAEWLERLIVAGDAWRRQDLAALESVPLGLTEPAAATSRVTWFCRHAGAHRAAFGDEALGRAVWYLMGVGCEVWRTVARARPADVVSAVSSLRSLYADVFAALPFPADGSRDTVGSLESAGYMLFDMDGGLLPLLCAGGAAGDAARGVVEHALGLDAPLCWYGALHALGHAHHHGGASFAPPMIDRFLAARGATLSPFFRRYAAAARAGDVA